MDLRRFMRLAVDQAALCPPDRARIGAVVVDTSGRFVTAHKFEDETTRHAEQILLEKATDHGVELHGATVFVTMEPCANIEGNRTACADLLIEAGIGTVYIGRYDLNFRINRQGWKRLTSAGVTCRDFAEEFRNELDLLNVVFQGHFLGRTGQLTGVARFDWTTNGGRYLLNLADEPDSPSWVTEWTTRGADSIYAYGGRPGTVALARYATSFQQIDDPGAYDFCSSSVPLGIGDIAIYRNAHGFALVRVLEVQAPPPYGNAPHVALKFEYELRPASPE